MTAHTDRNTTQAPTNRPLVVLLCLLVATLEGYDIQAFGVVAPQLVRQLGLDAGQQGWAASAAMFGLVVGAFAGGWFADRIGRKPVLLVATITFGLFSALTATAPNYELLMLARVATGLGFGGAMPNLIAIATEIAPARHRALTVTTMFCGMPAGGAAVSLLARALGQDLSWQTVFLIGGILPLLIAPAIFFLLPETRLTTPTGADRRASVTLFGDGRALATALLWLLFFLTLFVLYLMLNWLPSLIVAKGFTAADGSTAALCFNLMGIAGALVFGALIDRTGFVRPLTLSYVVLAATLFAMAAATGGTLLIALSAAAGFLVIGTQFSLYAAAPAFYAPHVRAFGAGAAVAMGRFGSIFGPLIAGELRQAGFSAGDVFGALIPVAIVAALATLALHAAAQMPEPRAP